ncbi:hypothetical protein [Rhodopirellula halodulae]|uniref:hypothetical protein n=1 Tax=Rhodopirellula halodulae TaxID=2894198 RepID=UPI001E419880|nr:hypothetical protein [Rhodopirellula sp. JC737]MCC9654365.1 hypothetical protein [Rhodopirellula sp. JC737]
MVNQDGDVVTDGGKSVVWIARCLSALPLIALLAVPASADPPRGRVVIHLLDPRGVIAGDHTMPTEWQNCRADVIGTRLLNRDETNRLRTLLRKELADDDNVPFCGHSPAYAVVVTVGEDAKKRDGGGAEKTVVTAKTNTVTLCGTCGTWARGGELRALHGNESLNYLDQLLPLPEVFRPVAGKRAPHLSPFTSGEPAPFEDLPASSDE